MPRGRPRDPLIDEGCRLMAEGRSTSEVLRNQVRNWAGLDAYTRYLAAKGLRQAARRRNPHAGKGTESLGEESRREIQP